MSTAAAKSSRREIPEKEFEQLLNENFTLVYEAAFKITGDNFDADDVAETVFTRLLLRGVPAGFWKNPKGYLSRAGTNEALRLLRYRKRRKWTKMPKNIDEIYPNSVGGDESNLELNTKEMLLDAIAQLKPADVELLALHYDGYTDAEMAKILGKPRGTIASALSRIRKTLTKLMCGEQHETQ